MRRFTAAGAITASILIASSFFVSATAQNEKLSPKVPCATTDTAGAYDLEFQFRSAVLSPLDGMIGWGVRVTMTVQNKAKEAIGVFLFSNETKHQLIPESLSQSLGRPA